MLMIDMEMPESCYDCLLNYREMGVCMVSLRMVADERDEIGGRAFVRYRENAYKRADNCPLREVEE